MALIGSAMDWTVPLDVIGRVAVATVLGTLIGLERERDGHPAGTRTVATVAIGAALFGVISTVGFDEYVAERSTTNRQVDVTRVASQVVVGIGFLGAGIIFRRGGSVQNLTTAATLWAVAAIGLAAGVGDVGLAAVGGALLLAVLVLLPGPQRWVLDRWGDRSTTLQLGCTGAVAAQRTRSAVEARPRTVVRTWKVEKRDGLVVVSAEVVCDSTGELDDLVGSVVSDEEVVDLRVDG